MAANLLLAFIVLVAAAFSQAAPNLKPDIQIHWQPIDQLCGQLEMATPKEKHIVVNGNSEERFYAAYLERATIALYPGTSSEEGCCKGRPVGTAESNKYGSFSFEGVRPGSYWLRVHKDHFVRVIPVHVLKNFDTKACHDPSVARSVVVDSKPPRIETRIR